MVKARAGRNSRGDECGNCRSGFKGNKKFGKGEGGKKLKGR